MISLGIDVGGSSVKLALIGDAGETLWQAQTSTYSQPSRQQLANVIRQTIGGRLDPSTAAVGICVPGMRNLAKRSVIQSVNLPALNGLVLDDLVADAVGGKPAHVEICSDSTATAFDIYATGKLAGRLCCLALGTGIGAAVLDDGVPLMVDGESPGHIGQMDVSIEGVPVIGPDNGAGSLEGYLGSPAIVKRYGPDMAKNLASFGPDDPPMRALARTIRICHALYVPHHVALAGGIGIRLKHLLPTIRQLVEKDLTRIARAGWTLACGEDEFHAARGAGKYAVSRALNSRSRA
jgi:predicted NBD/HSP70 family sugar kinase